LNLKVKGKTLTPNKQAKTLLEEEADEQIKGLNI
jgi:hypothetical protein